MEPLEFSNFNSRLLDMSGYSNGDIDPKSADTEILDLSCKSLSFGLPAEDRNTLAPCTSAKNMQQLNNQAHTEAWKNPSVNCTIVKVPTQPESPIMYRTYNNNYEINNDGLLSLNGSSSTPRLSPTSFENVVDSTRLMAGGGVVSKFHAASTSPSAFITTSSTEVKSLSSDTLKRTSRPFKAYSREFITLNQDDSNLFDRVSNVQYELYRQKMLEHIKKGTTTNNKMRRTSNRSGSPTSTVDEKDAVYWERRRKNNEAAKRSRDARRAKEDELAIRTTFLEQENMKLKYVIKAIIEQTKKLDIRLNMGPFYEINDNLSECALKF